MSKKQWTVTAVIVLVIVAALCIFYMPRDLERVIGLPDVAPEAIAGKIEGDVNEPIQAYKTDDTQKIEVFVSLLRELQVTYINGSSAYPIGEVSADVTMAVDGGFCRFFISDNGTVRCNDKNYRCKDAAALRDLLAQIESWGPYHESTPQTR